MGALKGLVSGLVVSAVAVVALSQVVETPVFAPTAPDDLQVSSTVDDRDAADGDAAVPPADATSSANNTAVPNTAPSRAAVSPTTESAETDPPLPQAEAPEPQPEDAADDAAPAATPSVVTLEDPAPLDPPDLSRTGPGTPEIGPSDDNVPPADAPVLPDAPAADPAANQPPEAPVSSQDEPAADDDNAAQDGDPLPAQSPENVVERGSQSGVRDAVPNLPDDDDSDDDSDAAAPMPTGTGNALADYAQPFENPDDLPLVSIILMDFGGAIVDVPLELTIAVDAAMPDARARAAAYYAAGYEVLVLPAFANGSASRDVERFLQASLREVPVAVGVIPDPGLDSDSATIDIMVSRLADTGHALVSFGSRQNSARRVAEQADVPSGVVFRQIDDDGQNPEAVRLFLDQAAFNARQDGAVILVGRNRSDTLRALVDWGRGSRAETLRLAPISAAIRAMAP